MYPTTRVILRFVGSSHFSLMVISVSSYRCGPTFFCFSPPTSFPLSPRRFRIHRQTVRMWLRRIAGSLVLGAILGGAGTYYAFPRIITASVSSSEPSSDARFSSSSAPSSWNAFKGQQQHQHQRHESSGSAEQIFADRLNNALFAARAGEAAAQQGLLVRIRCIVSTSVVCMAVFVLGLVRSVQHQTADLFRQRQAATEVAQLVKPKCAKSSISKSGLRLC